MPYGLGIDLGTTQTAAAVRGDDGRVDVVRLGGRRAEIPSLVFVKPDGGLLIGEAAERRGLTEPARLAREFKRRIGDPVPILVGGTPFSAHALTAKLLRHVLDTVAQLQDGPPSAITVTHPANWGPYKREQLDQAIRLADAGQVQVRSEPEAAALQHATARKIAPGETVCVYDLGGGTFDVAVLRRSGDGFQLLGEPEGIEQLGGIDFDEAVFGYVLETLGDKAEGLDPSDAEAVAALTRLRRDCVEAKEALSFDTETMIPVALPGLHTRIRLNRSELESMIAPSLADTIAATQRALRAAGVQPEDLSAILLAGGSSRIPLVAQLLSTEFQRPVIADPHPEHSIALGAAVSTAGVLGGPVAAVPPPRPAAGPASPPSEAFSPIATPRREEKASNGSAAAGSVPAQAGTAQAGTAQAGTAQAGTAQAGTAQAGFGTVSGPAGANSASAPSASPSPPVSPGRGSVPVAPGRNSGPVSFSRGAASVPGAGAAAAGTYAASASAATAPVSSPPAAPVSGSGGDGAPLSATRVYGTPLTDAPGSGAPAPGSGAAGSGGPVHGAPSGPTPLAAPPAGDSPFGAPPPGSGTPWPGLDEGKPRRNTRKLVIAGAAAAVILVAGGTAAALTLTRDRDNGSTPSGAGQSAVVPPPSADASAAAPAGPAPLPTDAILVRVDTGADSSAERTTKIFSFKPGTDTRTPLAGSQNGDVLPKWSHDRETVAVTFRRPGANDIYLMDRNGNNRRKILEDVSLGRVAWSPDDKKLAFMRQRNGVNQLFVQTLDNASESVQLTTGSDQKDDPAFSADGQSIIYWRIVGKVRQIFELNLADPKEPGRRIVGPENGPANDPMPSPDGKTLLYTREADAKVTSSDIWIINMDGTSPRRLTSDPAREMDATWSPDSTWFAFVRGPYERPMVVAMRPDGTGETLLTKNGQREGHPCWF